MSPDKELHPSIGAQTPGKHRRHSPTLGGKGTSFQDKAEGEGGGGKGGGGGGGRKEGGGEGRG